MATRTGQQLSEAFLRLDLESLRALVVESEILPPDVLIGASYDDYISHFTELIKAIIRNRFSDYTGVVRTNKNVDGLSVSIKSPNVERFFNLSHTATNYTFRSNDMDIRNEISEMRQAFDSPSIPLLMKENRVVFYFTYTSRSHFGKLNNNGSIRSCIGYIFEIISYIEKIETFDFNRFDELLELDQREYRAEQERYELERLARIEAERIRTEEANRQRLEQERLVREDYERRQALIQRGATEEGIDIANQLLDILGRR